MESLFTQMAKIGFGCRFHDLKYFKVGLFFIFLNFFITLRVLLQKFVEKYQFDVIFSYFKRQILDNYVFKIPTYTLLAPSSKIYRIS